MSDRLEEQLTSLSARLDLETGGRLVDDVLNRLDDSRPRRLVPIGRRGAVAAAALVAAAVLLVVMLPGPRRTVAHWFGIGSTLRPLAK